MTQSVITLRGPTASGKTHLTINLSNKLPLEIISVDSVMVYRGLNIGSAKPDQQTLENYPHHLIDICDPSFNYSLGNFYEDVNKAIESFNTFIEPTKCGEQMIEEFLEEHREIRLYKVRLNDKGVDFIIDNKKKMLEFFENLEVKVTKKLRASIPQN